MKTIPDGLLDEVVDRLVAEFDPEQVFLFGSHAWGEPTEDSDVDLMVVVREAEPGQAPRAERAYRSLRGLPIPVEVVVRTRSEMDRSVRVFSSLESEVRDRGVALYGGQSTRRIEGVARG